jgi:hypothetical protein
MTKKDYVAIARIIADHRASFDEGSAVVAVDEMSKDLCEYFERDNSSFDIIRFMRATRGVS